MATITNAYDTLFDQLLHQFQYSPNILKLLTVLADPIQDTIDVAEFILTADSLDDCQGEQLDFWGELIGVKRPQAQESLSNIFTLCELGEAGDQANNTGFYDDTDTVVTGGYLTSLTGLPDQSDPGATMGDDDYRYMIKQKAASFRRRMTHANLFNYLIAFGTRCKIDGETEVLGNWISPVDYYGEHGLSDFFKNYIETRGFKPAGISVDFEGNLRKDEL